MNRLAGIFISLACCLAAVSIARAGNEGIARRSLDEYSIIFERNIFDRSRRPSSQQQPSPRPQPQPQPPPPRTERHFILRGTVREGADQYIAFVENTRNNSVVFVRAGDSLAEGRVADITLDCVVYESDRGTVEIEIGRNFEGAAVAASRPAAQTGARTAPSGANERELLEMLRRRREQESGRVAPPQRAPEQTEDAHDDGRLNDDQNASSDETEYEEN